MFWDFLISYILLFQKYNNNALESGMRFFDMYLRGYQNHIKSMMLPNASKIFIVPSSGLIGWKTHFRIRAKGLKAWINWENPITYVKSRSSMDHQDDQHQQDQQDQQEQENELEEVEEQVQQQVQQQQINIVHVNFLAMFECGSRRCERCMTRHG